MKLCPTFLFLGILTYNSTAYNILILFPYASKSLHLLFSSIALPLAQNGHNVTTLTSYDPYFKHPNIEHHQPRDFMKDVATDNLWKIDSYFSFMKTVHKSFTELPQKFWATPEVLDLYKRRSEYEVILFSSYFNEFLFPFLDGFDGHFVSVCTPGVEYTSLTHSGNWPSPAVFPNIQLPYDEHMNFYERLINGITFAFDFIAVKYIILPTTLSSLRVNFPDFGDLWKYYERTSLTLINGHFSLDSPVPLLPNQVEIGTINARKPKPLPQDLQDIFDKAPPEGVIYFSLGSFAPSKSIPRKYKEIFVEAFRRIPHQVIWRYDEQDFDFPPNVHTSKWLPQEDILGDPKTKVFISHCGNLGTQEAKFHGVPVLAMPIAFDQPRNAARLVRKGYGVIVNWDDLTVDRLIESIDTLTKDNTYYERMKNVSKIVQDQIDSPAERAAWWVEYVIRHDGAPHLRYAGQRLSFWQYIMVDVLAFWAVVFGLIVVVFIWTLKALWRKCFGKKKKTKKE